jgi:lysophospholipid acyltransferase (LPLAT)-like uncharacterized protein
VKIRRPWAVKALGFAAACLVRLWLGTLRFRYRPLGPNIAPGWRGLDRRYIYAFWHEYLLLPAYQYGGAGVRVLVSGHADGRLIAEACRLLGFGTVRGSTTREAVAGLRELIRHGRCGHLSVTPDGPRGPRRRVQPGLVYLAAKTGLPIVPGGLAFGRAWRLRSWDRFALPHPWTTAACVTTEPIAVPPDVRKGQLEAYRLRVEEALATATAEAERVLAAA